MPREKKVAAMKLSTGSIRRRGRGVFYYRCQINGKRTEISLQTNDYNENNASIKKTPLDRLQPIENDPGKFAVNGTEANS